MTVPDRDEQDYDVYVTRTSYHSGTVRAASEEEARQKAYDAVSNAELPAHDVDIETAATPVPGTAQQPPQQVVDDRGQRPQPPGGVIDVPAGRGEEFGAALIADAKRHEPRRQVYAAPASAGSAAFTQTAADRDVLPARPAWVNDPPGSHPVPDTGTAASQVRVECVYQVEGHDGLAPEEADGMRPQTGAWELSEGDDGAYHGGTRHRKWVAHLTEAEYVELLDELDVPGGRLSDGRYGHADLADAYSDDPDLVHVGLYAEPVELSGFSDAVPGSPAALGQNPDQDPGQSL